MTGEPDLAILVAVVVPLVAVAIHGVVAVAWIVPDRRVKRTLAR